MDYDYITSNQKLNKNERKIVWETWNGQLTYHFGKWIGTGRCFCCLKKIEWTNTVFNKFSTTNDTVWNISHIIAVSKGGTLSFENLRTCCYYCNSNKRDVGMGTQNMYGFMIARRMPGLINITAKDKHRQTMLLLENLIDYDAIDVSDYNILYNYLNSSNLNLLDRNVDNIFDYILQEKDVKVLIKCVPNYTIKQEYNINNMPPGTYKPQTINGQRVLVPVQLYDQNILKPPTQPNFMTLSEQDKEIIMTCISVFTLIMLILLLFLIYKFYKFII